MLALRPTCSRYNNAAKQTARGDQRSPARPSADTPEIRVPFCATLASVMTRAARAAHPIGRAWDAIDAVHTRQDQTRRKRRIRRRDGLHFRCAASGDRAAVTIDCNLEWCRGGLSMQKREQTAHKLCKDFAVRRKWIIFGNATTPVVDSSRSRLAASGEGKFHKRGEDDWELIVKAPNQLIGQLTGELIGRSCDRRAGRRKNPRTLSRRRHSLESQRAPA